MIRTQTGMTLIETVIALLVCMVVSVGLLPVAVVSILAMENQVRSSEAFAQAEDKLHQLNRLQYSNLTCDTTVSPSTDMGGTGLTVGGSSDPKVPVGGYVDYANVDGLLCIRVWRISMYSPTVKQITVTARMNPAYGLPAEATVSMLKQTDGFS